MIDFDDSQTFDDAEDFEKMLEDSLSTRDNFETGEEVDGTIVQITHDQIFVDISGKSEAIIDVTEFQDESGQLTIQKGDKINAYVVSTNRGEVVLTTAIGSGVVSKDLLELAYRKGIPVSGTVIQTVKSGYTVSVGGTRCFCPLSQVDMKVPNNPESMLHKTLQFKIIRYESKGNNIVVSRRALLDESRKERIEELKKTLSLEDTVTGSVSSVAEFGVFVDLGGVDALVPRSELTWSRYSDPCIFEVGQEVTGKVIDLDWDEQKITLSTKQLQPRPWENITSFHEGDTISGTVVKCIRNGAFVELTPGLEGFIPVSRMSYTRRISRPEDVCVVNDQVQVKILEIDTSSQKMTLELLTGEADPWEQQLDEDSIAIHKATVESVRTNGIIARLENGMQGFIPHDETMMPRGSDLQKEYSTGKTLNVVIKDINRKDKKLFLSERQALKAEEKKDYHKFMKKQEEDTGSTSAFGKLFKEKFEELNDDSKQKG